MLVSDNVSGFFSVVPALEEQWARGPAGTELPLPRDLSVGSSRQFINSFKSDLVDSLTSLYMEWIGRVLK